MGKGILRASLYGLAEEKLVKPILERVIAMTNSLKNVDDYLFSTEERILVPRG